MKQCCLCGSTAHNSPACPANKKDGCKVCGGKRECSRVECPLRRPLTVDCSGEGYVPTLGGYKRRTGSIE